MSRRRLVLGTRGSRLALAQAELCARRLRESGLEVEIRTIKATSDHRPEEPLSRMDERDVFTRQLDEALLQGGIDLAVHSCKDVPTEIPSGIFIVATVEREDPRDVLVSDAQTSLDALPAGATVATSSLRRRSQLLHLRPDLHVVEIRGNIDTRLQKLARGDALALVLARAGLLRLKLDVRYTVMPVETLVPAVGQGALAVTMREGDPLAGVVRGVLDHRPTAVAVEAERAFLRALEGGCRVPVGANAVVEGGEVRLRGRVGSVDGSEMYEGEASGAGAREVGERLAGELLARGAGRVLEEVRRARSGA